jgi:hypothetical protein
MAASPPMPGAFDRLPSEVREQATVVLTGRLQVGRGPCELLPDGSRRWALLRGFRPTAVHRGDVAADYIGVTEPRLLGSEGALVDGEEYLVALRPSMSSLNALHGRTGGGHPRQALPPEEVLAIVALSGKPPEAQD